MKSPDLHTLNEADHTNEDIAEQIQCSLRKVTLRLEYIRETWQESAADDQDTNSDDEV